MQLPFFVVVVVVFFFSGIGVLLLPGLEERAGQFVELIRSGEGLDE